MPMKLKVINNQSNAPFMAKYIVLILTEKKRNIYKAGSLY